MREASWNLIYRWRWNELFLLLERITFALASWRLNWGRPGSKKRRAQETYGKWRRKLSNFSCTRKEAHSKDIQRVFRLSEKVIKYYPLSLLHDTAVHTCCYCFDNSSFIILSSFCVCVLKYSLLFIVSWVWSLFLAGDFCGFLRVSFGKVWIFLISRIRCLIRNKICRQKFNQGRQH